jgi:hypothetical protein
MNNLRNCVLKQLSVYNLASVVTQLQQEPEVVLSVLLQCPCGHRLCETERLQHAIFLFACKYYYLQDITCSVSVVSVSALTYIVLDIFIIAIYSS